MILGFYVLSNIGFAGSNLCYDSFLTDVTTRERMDKVSAWGYAMGYIGGSTIPFLAAIALVMLGPSIGIDNATAIRISVVITVLWWGGFSIPFFRHVRQRYYTGKKERPCGQGNVRQYLADSGDDFSGSAASTLYPGILFLH